MRPETIHELIRRMPFQPFRLTLTDGRTYDIYHPELIMVGRDTVSIGLKWPNAVEPTYDRLVMVSLIHIMQAEKIGTAAPPVGS